MVFQSKHPVVGVKAGKYLWYGICGTLKVGHVLCITWISTGKPNQAPSSRDQPQFCTFVTTFLCSVRSFFRPFSDDKMVKSCISYLIAEITLAIQWLQVTQRSQLNYVYAGIQPERAIWATFPLPPGARPGCSAQQRAEARCSPRVRGGLLLR